MTGLTGETGSTGSVTSPSALIVIANSAVMTMTITGTPTTDIWDSYVEIIDTTNNFDPVAGSFTVPSTGIYTISFGGQLTTTSVLPVTVNTVIFDVGTGLPLPGATTTLSSAAGPGSMAPAPSSMFTGTLAAGQVIDVRTVYVIGGTVGSTVSGSSGNITITMSV